MRRALVAAAAAAALHPAAAIAAPRWPYPPTPIGRADAYHPAPGWPPPVRAAPAGPYGDIDAGIRIHLELFARGRVIVVPGGIGVSGERTTLYGTVTGALWHAPAWTLQPGGVIHLARPGMRLGAAFAVWGRPLGTDGLLGFRGAVRTFVNGAERFGDPAELRLRDHDQVVLEVGGHIRPHPSFAFPPPPP